MRSRRPTFDLDDVFSKLRRHLQIRNELDEVVDCVNRGMDRLEALDLLSDSVRIVYSHIYLFSRSSSPQRFGSVEWKSRRKNFNVWGESLPLRRVSSLKFQMEL